MLTRAGLLELPTFPLLGEDAPKILVSLCLTNGRFVPGRIPFKGEVSRTSTSTQKDSENQVVQNLPNVTIQNLRKGLSRFGFRRVDVHRKIKRYEHARKTQFVVNFLFTKTGNDQLPLVFDHKTEKAIRDLAMMPWGWAHIYDNPGGPVSIILLNRSPDVLAQHTIVARKGILQVEAVA